MNIRNKLVYQTTDKGESKDIMQKRTIKTDITDNETPSPVSGQKQDTDLAETSLRPTALSSYIGQSRLKEQVSVAIASAKARHTSLDHILLYGPPGLGKTTMAYIIAEEMGCKLHYLTGPQIERPGDIASALSRMQEGDILFIDEIHRCDPKAEEVLYSAMEDFFINIQIGGSENGQGRTVKLELPKFTLIGATTRAGMISTPLHDRFGLIYQMQYYDEEELMQIVQITSEKMGLSMEPEYCLDIALRSRGTPRIANRFVARVRDYAYAKSNGEICHDTVSKALTLAGVDEMGLDLADRKLICSLSEVPVGLTTLSCILGEDPGTIENVQEPWLIMNGYVKKTPKGRILTERGLDIKNDIVEREGLC